MEAPHGEENGMIDQQDRQTKRQRQEQRADAVGRGEQRIDIGHVPTSVTFGQKDGWETLARATDTGGNEGGHPSQGGRGAGTHGAQEAVLFPGWVQRPWENPATSFATGGGDIVRVPQQWPAPAHVGNTGTVGGMPCSLAMNERNAIVTGGVTYGQQGNAAVSKRFGAVDSGRGGRGGVGRGRGGGRGRGWGRGGSRNAGVNGGAPQDDSDPGKRPAVLSAERRSPTALAAYEWGLELHKGGVKEVFTATVEKAEMAKVWANGDVTINTGTAGRTPATKTILNLILAVFKVEILDDDSDGKAVKETIWRVVHSSGYKQVYAENMNMSLFPNRDWPYTKTKLKRLPTKIFLPKPPRPSNAKPVPNLPVNGSEQYGHIDAATPGRTEAAGKGGCSGDIEILTNRSADYDDRVSPALYPADNNGRSDGSNGRHQRAAAAALAAMAAAFGAPHQASADNLHPLTNSLGSPLGNPAVFAAAAIKDGVPPHLIHHVMMSGGAAAALSGKPSPSFTAAMAAAGAAAAAVATQASTNGSMIAGGGAVRGQGNRGEPSVYDVSGRGRTETIDEVEQDNAGFEHNKERGRNDLLSGENTEKDLVRNVSTTAPAVATRITDGSFNELDDDGAIDSSRSNRDGIRYSRRIRSRSDSRGGGDNNGRLKAGGSATTPTATVADWHRPTPSPEAWKPWQPGDNSPSPSPSRGRVDVDHRESRSRNGKMRYRGSDAIGREDGERWRRRRQPEGQWDRRSRDDYERESHRRDRDAAGFVRGSSREQRGSRERRRQRKRREDLRERRLVPKGRSDPRDLNDPQRGGSRRPRSFSQEKGSPWSSPDVRLSPFSRALARGSRNSNSPAGAIRESFDRDGADARSGSDELDDASTGRPEQDKRFGDTTEQGSGTGENTRADVHGGNAGGGSGQRRESYDPDQYDPNAYDPGEVTVKRENSNKHVGAVRRSASSESLTKPSVRERSSSLSRSLTPSHRDQGGEFGSNGAGGSVSFVGYGEHGIVTNRQTGECFNGDAARSYAEGAGGGILQLPLLGHSTSQGSVGSIALSGQPTVTEYAASSGNPAAVHMAGMTQPAIGSVRQEQQQHRHEPAFQAPLVVFNHQLAVAPDGALLHSGWKANGGFEGRDGSGEGRIRPEGLDPDGGQQPWELHHPSQIQNPIQPATGHHGPPYSHVPNHEQGQQQQQQQQQPVFVPQRHQEEGGSAVESAAPPPPPARNAGVWISGGGSDRRRP